MTARLVFTTSAIALVALLAACGGGGGSDAATAAPDTAAADTALVDPHDAARAQSTEETHSGAYNLIEDAESTVDDLNRRTHEMESRLGDH